MAYVAPIHRPSCVRHALKLRFLDSNEECLAVAKANRLEIYTQPTPGSLVLSYSEAIYGKITVLKKLKLANSPRDYLFVGTDLYMYFVISWDPELQRIRTERSFLKLADETGRDSPTHDRCLLDPADRFLVLQLYDGMVTVIPLAAWRRRAGAKFLGEPVVARITDRFIRSSTFLYPRPEREKGEKSDPTKIAFLFEDNQRNTCFRIRSLEHFEGDPGHANLDPTKVFRSDLDPHTSHLIPVPAPIYGLLILSETSIIHYNENTRQEVSLTFNEATVFVTWEQIDNKSWLLADEYGRLYLCRLLLGNAGVTGFKIDIIGTTSRASVLVYLNNGYAFIGSKSGDSQVINISEGGEVMQSLSNLGPILDFSIMDMGSRSAESQVNEYSSGQARIVTGSGAFNDGSLRSVRSGVVMEEQGTIVEMDHIIDLFALRASSESKYVNLLVVSLIEETRIFQFLPEGEIEEHEEYKGFSLSESTLLASNISKGRLLQVTGASIHIVDSEDGVVTSSWSPTAAELIISASANDEYLAIALGGTEAIIFLLSEDLDGMVRRKFDTDDQIACIHVPHFSNEFCVVGFWGGAVAILKMGSLETIQKIVVSEEAVSVPRSILLVNILQDEFPTLLIAMSSGEVVTFTLSTKDLSLSTKKVVVLGTQHAKFKVLPRGDFGLSNVFATCEHSSLIYESEGRIVFSAVTADEATCICSFNYQASPGAIAIATDSELKIAVLDTERTTHVQTLTINETVRRVAYSSKLRAFGLGTVRRTLKENHEIIHARFKLADEVLFKQLDTYELDEDEIVESVIRADLLEESGEWVERFIVGTGSLTDGRGATSGRIIIFAVTSDRLLKVIAELPVSGACRALGVVEGRIAVALDRTVEIYAFWAKSLRKVASYLTCTAPMDIAVTGNIIAIADLMKSVTLVEYIRGVNGLPDTLNEIGRHFSTVWATAVADIDRNTFLESDAEGNLMLLHRDKEGLTEDDKRRLEITSEIRLGEMVNRIRTLDVAALPDAVVIPKAFLATVEGSIYLFALIPPHTQTLLFDLQTLLAGRIPSLGGITFNSFRAFKNQIRQADEPFRFVDGELIEKFLDLDENVGKEVVGSLSVNPVKWNYEGVRLVVERLKRLR